MRRRTVVRRPVTFRKSLLPSNSTVGKGGTKGGTKGKQHSPGVTKPPPFLTSSQLSDLFTRLDKNSDGELDLYEFTGIIRALRLNESEDFVAEIFRTVDTAASGTLDLQEFICAYQKIHQACVNKAAHAKDKDKEQGDKKGRQRDDKAEFIRATRYGTNEYGQPVFTLYTIEYRNGKSQGFKYDFLAKKNDENDMKEGQNEDEDDHDEEGEEVPPTRRTHATRHSFFSGAIANSRRNDNHGGDGREGDASTNNNGNNNNNQNIPIEVYFQSVQKEVYLDGLDGIMKMMRRDSKLNVDHFDESQCRLLWWMDIALYQVGRSTIGRYVDLFGLPNESKFLSNFGNFGNVMSKDEKSHVFVGDGVTVHGPVHSMSMFVQTASLVNRPILHLLPSGFDRPVSALACCSPQGLKDWITTQLDNSNDTDDSSTENSQQKQSIINRITNYVATLLLIWIPILVAVLQSLITFSKEYYRSRFAFLLNFSSLSDTNEKETMACYEVSDSIAQRLREGATEPLELNTVSKPEDEDVDDDSDSSDDESETPKISKTIGVISLRKSQVAPNPEIQLTSVVPSSSSGTGSSAGKTPSGSNENNEGPTSSIFDIVTSRGEALPLPRIRKYATPPNWVASASHIQNKPPTIKFDTLGLHVLDHGPGANTLLTIRVLDNQEKVKENKLRTINRITQKREVKQLRRRRVTNNNNANAHSNNVNNGVSENGSFRQGAAAPAKLERKSSIFNVLTNSGNNNNNDSVWTIEERSRAGVIGRILDGAWLKILENVALDGVTDIAGELDDSPTTLACFLAMLLHSYSMTNLGALDYWINMVEADVQDIVVSKHMTHVQEMHRIVRELNAYVEPTTQLFNRFFQQWENDSKAQAKANAQSMDGAVVKRASVTGNPKRTSLVVPFSQQGGPGSGFERRGTCRRPSILVSQMKSQPMALRRNSVIGDFDKIPLSFLLIKRFFGDQAYRDLRLLLDGYEGMELKGLLYWQERLGKLETKLQEVDAFIDVSMEEKRNFTTFTMTIITTLLAPLTILTGYFGMNFENMYELDPETYPSVPGVKLLWLLSGIVYIVLLILAVHFRIIYSAT